MVIGSRSYFSRYWLKPFCYSYIIVSWQIIDWSNFPWFYSLLNPNMNISNTDSIQMSSAMSQVTQDTDLISTMAMESTSSFLKTTVTYAISNITNSSTFPNITILKPAPACTEPGKEIYLNNLIWLFISLLNKKKYFW